MDSENVTQIMEFGDFITDLPQRDRAFINKILFSPESSCKEGKRPEFSWIESTTPSAAENSRESVQNFSAEDTSTDDLDVPDNAAVPPPAGAVPQLLNPYGYYSPPQFMGYAPGVPIGMPIPVTSVPMMATPVTVVYAPPPVSAAIDSNVVRIDTQVHDSQEKAVPIGISNPTPQREDNESPVNEGGRKRRNKKKRPPGYYEELAARQQHPKEEGGKAAEQRLSPDKRDGIQQTVAENAIQTSDSKEPGRIGEIMPKGPCIINSEVPEHLRSNLSCMSNQCRTQTDAQKQQARTLSEQTVTCENEHTVRVTNSRDASQIEEEGGRLLSDSQTPVSRSVENESTAQILTTSNQLLNAQLTQQNDQYPAGSNSEPAKEQQICSIPGESNKQCSASAIAVAPETGSVESAGECESVAADTTAAREDKAADGCNYTDDVSKGEGDGNESVPPVKETPGDTEGERPSEPAPPKKPTSWAGLFSGTKQAQAATVIYTGRKKEIVAAEIGSDRPSPTPKDTTPEVVPVAEDQSAKLIAGKIVAHRLNHKPLALVPRGLTNRKTWCYVNATLQALLACPPFYHLMKALPAFPDNSRGPSSSPFTDALVRFVNEFSSMHERPAEKAWLNAKGTMKLDIPQGKTFEPTYVYDVLRLEKYAAHFILGRQEDAEEFLGCVLNGMHEEMVGALGVLNPSQPEPPPVKNGDVAEEDSSSNVTVIDEEGWEQVGPKNKAVITRSTNYSISPISQVFQGQIRSILHQTGTRESATLQPFFTLQLDIQSDKVWSVKDALEYLVKKESLQDYTCTKTKQEIEASRRIVLEELPPVLILHLKYFVFDKNGGSQKLTKHIDFTENLEISKDFLSPNIRTKLLPSQRKYKLFAVVNHHGARLLGGHYTTYVFHCGVNGWIHIDDDLVRTVKIDAMLKHSPPKVPYLLYYRKVDL